VEGKADVRERVWTALEAEAAAPPGVRGRIPAFVGSVEAAVRLTHLPEWQRAQTVQANPDYAQQPVRSLALRDGKVLFMAVPNLAHRQPFYRLDPSSLGDNPQRAGDRHVAADLASLVDVSDLPPIDLVVCGSVAVNRAGVRIGKGAGYSDLEVDVIVAPREVIRCSGRRRPRGVDWDQVTPAMIEAMPVLDRRA
jgi:5-formyltetrahydrofolate cyclo-ligase